MTKLDLKNTALGRRQFLETGGKIGLSGAAIALLSGVNTACAETPATNLQLETDVRILNTALSAEHEAVAAYQVGAESGLLTPGVLKVAVKFQGHHKEHIDLLASTVKKLGGTPTDAKQQYSFPVHQLNNERDVLTFAAGLERGAVSAYVGAIPLFDNGDLAKAAASILADEAMHWAILRQALGLDPVPGAFFS
ncbi:ferritin-like domain-containing protein [Sessilibacter corallicola]|uniref:Ferritin-like domain-containing protein n=1 Tax=Sessilibacter corallicola TaxID=2904075 RepID=A0ABQ0AEP0_9GAMM